MQRARVWSLGWEDPLEMGMATHSSILPWKIPWTEEPRGVRSIGSERVGHDWVTELNWALRIHYPLNKCYFSYLVVSSLVTETLSTEQWWRTPQWPPLCWSANKTTKRIFVKGSPGSFYTDCLSVLSCVRLFVTPWTYSLPGSSVQPRILERVAILISRGSSQPRDQTWVSCISCIGRRFFTTETPGKPSRIPEKISKGTFVNDG